MVWFLLMETKTVPIGRARLWGQLVVGLAECTRSVMAPTAQRAITRYRRHVPPYEAQRQR